MTTNLTPGDTCMVDFSQRSHPIHMDNIRPEIRELVVAWDDSMFIGDKVKLASDIQNLVDRLVQEQVLLSIPIK